MRIRHAWLIVLGAGLSAGLMLGACSKSESKSTKQVDTAGTVGADGVRRVAIEAGKGGYKPDKIPAKPGEQLILVFTRTATGECLSEIKVAGGEAKPLPMNTPVEVAVSIPEEGGDVRFACGMDMYTGVIAVK